LPIIEAGTNASEARNHNVIAIVEVAIRDDLAFAGGIHKHVACRRQSAIRLSILTGGKP